MSDDDGSAVHRQKLALEKKCVFLYSASILFTNNFEKKKIRRYKELNVGSSNGALA